jgi:hypothetical protein
MVGRLDAGPARSAHYDSPRSFRAFAHLASTALRAASLRSSGVSLDHRACAAFCAPAVRCFGVALDHLARTA